MSIVLNEIRAIAELLELEVEEMNGDWIIEKVIEKYCLLDKYKFPIWDNLIDSLSIKDSQGWKIQKRFLPEERRILFVEPCESNSIFIFKSSGDLSKLLGDSFGFSFYLTDSAATYLMCFNDHDYFICSGVAKDWLMSKGNDGAE